MATNSPSNIATAASGTVLQGAGVGTAPTFSTATYPSTAGTSGKVLISDGTNIVSSTPTFPNSASSSGKILRADGTNWVATTSTYPDTNAVSTLLYASSANVMGALATANSGVLSTSSSGVPSIDTTNFAVLTTGLQLKGNNTNTAPPAGFIGQQISSSVSAVSVSNNTAKSITSISLTAGIWDVSMVATAITTGLSTTVAAGISPTDNSFTGAVLGDSYVQNGYASVSGADISLSVPSFRITLSGTTIYYLACIVLFSTGSCTVNGRISGTRVG